MKAVPSAVAVMNNPRIMVMIGKIARAARILFSKSIDLIGFRFDVAAGCNAPAQGDQR